MDPRAVEESSERDQLWASLRRVPGERPPGCGAVRLPPSATDHFGTRSHRRGRNGSTRPRTQHRNKSFSTGTLNGQHFLMLSARLSGTWSLGAKIACPIPRNCRTRQFWVALEPGNMLRFNRGERFLLPEFCSLPTCSGLARLVDFTVDVLPPQSCGGLLWHRHRSAGTKPPLGLGYSSCPGFAFGGLLLRLGFRLLDGLASPGRRRAQRRAASQGKGHSSALVIVGGGDLPDAIRNLLFRAGRRQEGPVSRHPHCKRASRTKAHLFKL